MLCETRFHVLSKSLLSLHYSPASCHSLHPLDLLTSLLSLSIISLFLLILISLSFCPGSFEVVPAPIHVVLFPAFSCSFGPLLQLLLAPMQDDCCSWTLKTQHSKVLSSVQTMQTKLKLECSLGRLRPKGNRPQRSRQQCCLTRQSRETKQNNLQKCLLYGQLLERTIQNHFTRLVHSF